MIGADGSGYEPVDRVGVARLRVVHVAPGDSRAGVVVFELPEAAQPTDVVMTLEEGYGPDTAHWSLAEKAGDDSILLMRVGSQARPYHEPWLLRDLDAGDADARSELTLVVTDAHYVRSAQFLSFSLRARNAGSTVQVWRGDVETLLVTDDGLGLKPMGFVASGALGERMARRDDALYERLQETLGTPEGPAAQAEFMAIGSVDLSPGVEGDATVMFHLPDGFRPAMLQATVGRSAEPASCVAEWDIRPLVASTLDANGTRTGAVAHRESVADPAFANRRHDIASAHRGSGGKARLPRWRPVTRHLLSCRQ